MQDVAQAQALFGEFVDHSWRDFGVDRACDDALVFQRAQPVGQGFRADRADPCAQFGEPQRPGQQFAHDQRGPFAIEHLQGSGDGTFAVVPRVHQLSMNPLVKLGFHNETMALSGY